MSQIRHTSSIVRANDSQDGSFVFTFYLTSMAAHTIKRVGHREEVAATLVPQLKEEQKKAHTHATGTFFKQIIAQHWHNSVHVKLPDPPMN